MKCITVSLCTGEMGQCAMTKCDFHDKDKCNARTWSSLSLRLTLIRDSF